MNITQTPTLTYTNPPTIGVMRLRRTRSLPTHRLSSFSLTPPRKRRHSQTPRQKEEGEGRVEGEEGPPHTEVFVGLPSVEVETLHISSMFVPPWGRWGKGEGGQGGGWAIGKGLK